MNKFSDIRRRTVLASACLLPTLMLAGTSAGKSKVLLSGTKVMALRRRLSGTIYTSDDTGYAAARLGQGMTPVTNRFPAVIALPEGPADIAQLLRFAQVNALEVSVRSGGHDALDASTTDAGVLIDLSQMDAIKIDRASRTWARAHAPVVW